MKTMYLKTEKILLVLSVVFILSVVMASLGIAYAGGVRGVGLIGGCFFLTFGIIIVLGQLIPAGILLSHLVGTVFSSPQKTEIPIQAA
jgi:hypothetical protein